MKSFKTIFVLGALVLPALAHAAVPSQLSSTAVLERIIESFNDFESFLYRPISEDVLPVEWSGGAGSNLTAEKREIMALELRRVQYPEVRLINTLAMTFRPPKDEENIVNGIQLADAKLKCERLKRKSESCLLDQSLRPRFNWMLRSFEHYDIDQGVVWHKLKEKILGPKRFKRTWNQDEVNTWMKR